MREWPLIKSKGRSQMHLTFLIGSNLCHEINLLQRFKCSWEKMFQTSIQIKRSVRPPHLLSLFLLHTRTHMLTHKHSFWYVLKETEIFEWTGETRNESRPLMLTHTHTYSLSLSHTHSLTTGIECGIQISDHLYLSLSYFRFPIFECFVILAVSQGCHHISIRSDLRCEKLSLGDTFTNSQFYFFQF